MVTAIDRIDALLAGITKADGAGLGVATGDYNGDGWLDLYVANDATPNQLWINQKNGTFVDDGPLAGVALNAAGVPEGSMGIASGDYDRILRGEYVRRGPNRSSAMPMKIRDGTVRATLHRPRVTSSPLPSPIC